MYNHYNTRPKAYNHYNIRPTAYNHYNTRPTAYNHYNTKPTAYNHYNTRPTAYNHYNMAVVGRRPVCRKPVDGVSLNSFPSAEPLIHIMPAAAIIIVIENILPRPPLEGGGRKAQNPVGAVVLAVRG